MWWVFFKETTFDVLDGCHQLHSIWGSWDRYSTLSNPSGNWELNSPPAWRCSFGAGAEALWASMFSWEILHVWSLVREFDGKAAHHKLWLGDDNMAQLCLSGAELQVSCWALPAGVHQCEQGEGTDTWSPVQALDWIMCRKQSPLKNQTSSQVSAYLCLSFILFLIC